MPAYPVRESDDNLNRIIGGWEARPHSLPWQLYVLLGYTFNYIYFQFEIILSCRKYHMHYFQGDSGGPLFCKVNNVYVQYGIVSYRPLGFRPGSLSVYTRLSTYINWLKISAWKYDRD
ncbi:hypothetical protein D917_03746 [Trichinella nativa]|uniref:Peptidase S1 domain-containing protein n=1 Tax=Trichinella nativa TaxID=6335 RepID=A0A1Y3E764_9BILA|nr:hypothetical protein D917_03746 [Trichinella nativa]